MNPKSQSQGKTIMTGVYSTDTLTSVEKCHRCEVGAIFAHFSDGISGR
jgi:hypothetical protein